jgi:hypothetical protein
MTTTTNNHDVCEMVSYTVPDKKINYRRYLCPTSFVFDTRYIHICICIRIRSYPCLNTNPNKNMKTHMVSIISIRIQSDYTYNLLLGILASPPGNDTS